MPRKQDLLAKAEEFLRLAAEPGTVAVTAVLLRMLAADYLEMANSGWTLGSRHSQRSKAAPARLIARPR